MSVKDILISIFLLAIGVLVVLLGLGVLDLIETTISMAYMMYIYVSGMMAPGLASTMSQSISLPFWAWIPGWIVITLGITTIVYGIKRLLDNILKIMVIRSKNYV